MIEINLDEAIALLRSHSCLTEKVLQSESEREQLRSAVIQVCRLADWENIGVCAPTIAAGLAALEQYAQALGYNKNTVTRPSGEFADDQPVYLKFNTQRLACYGDRYEGDYRGVLIACQGEDERVLGTYGYFPLDLFAQ